MSDPTNCAATRNAISSPASAAGASRSTSPDGPTTAPSGPGAAPANLSARQAQEAGLLTSGTYGRTGTISFESAALQRSLASRLQARTASVGSTLYKLTWKERTTPAGRPIPALRASARRISAKGNGSVPTICDLPQVGYNTPRATDGKNGGPNQAGGALSHDASLASWATPNASNGSGGGQEKRFLNPERSNELNDQVMLAGWSTASARDWKDTPGMSMMATNPDGSERTRADQLPRQAVLAGWPTSSTMDSGNTGNAWEKRRERVKNDLGNGNGFGLILPMASQLATPCRLTVHGEMLTGSSAEMTSGGQLNPEHSRWLMGYPAVWGSCGATAMQSIRGRRKSSSKRTSVRAAKSSTTKPIDPFS